MSSTFDAAKAVPIPDRVSREYLVHHQVCPVGELPDGKLAVLVTPRSALEALDDLSIAYQREIVPELTTPEDIARRIARLAADETPLEVAQPQDNNETFTSDVRDLANQPPVIR